MGKNTDNKTITLRKESILKNESIGNDFIKNFNQITSNQLSVVESDEQIGLDFISRIINTYDAKSGDNLESILKKIGYSDETTVEVMNGCLTISEDEFQSRLYDYYISPF